MLIGVRDYMKYVLAYGPRWLELSNGSLTLSQLKVKVSDGLSSQMALDLEPAQGQGLRWLELSNAP